MKNSKKNGQLPLLYSQTPRVVSKNPLFQTEIGSLQEFEPNESNMKTHPTERKGIDLNLGLPTFLNRNFSHPDTFAPLSTSSIRFTQKTMKMISNKKKTERSEKVTLLEKISELKVLLHKYKAPETPIIVPARLDVKKTVQCLELLNDADSNMKDVMELIIRVLKGSIYINPHLLDKYYDDVMASDSEELKKIFMSSDQSYIPYFTLSVVLLNAFTRQEGKRIDYTKQLESKIKDLYQEIQDREEVILNLQEKLQTAITKDVYGQIIEELRSARERASSFFEENKKLNMQIEELMEENAHINKQYEEECAEVEKRVAIIQEMERNRLNMLEDGENNVRKISECKESISNLENTFGQIIKRVEDMKKLFMVFQERNDELVSENDRLNAVIAANGTEALTPRPDYRTLQEEKKIEVDIFDSLGKSQVIATSVIVDELMKKIAELTQKNQDPSLKEGIKIINPALAKLNSNRGGRSRAGSFNINSPLKPPPKTNNLNTPTQENTPTLPNGKSMFGRMAPKPSQFGSGPSPSQFSVSPSQFGLGQSPNKAPSQFGNTLMTPTSIYDFKSPAGDDYLVSKEDSLPSPDDSSPDYKTESSPKSESRFMLKIEIPRMGRRANSHISNNRGESIDKANELIRYIMRTKEEIEIFASLI